MTLFVGESLRTFATTRNDDWGSAVLLRIGHFSDLVAQESRYHRQCYQHFYRIRSNIPGETTHNSRTVDPQKDDAFEKLCAFIEENDDC